MVQQAKKATFLASLGAGLEYYDFIIYGMMAGHLSSLFFTADEAWVAMLKTFGVFAIGYFIRPLGGIFFGTIGDAFGRKKTFLAVMLLMALSTLCMGLLPTYSQAGALAPCLLIFLRLLQGLSFGAELPGAITVVCEYAEKKNHGTHSGFVISSVSMGSLLASLVLYVMSQTSSTDQILSWGWRIPFILGGLLAVANYFIRKHLAETPEFSRHQKAQPTASIKAPLSLLLTKYKATVALGVGLTALQSGLVIFVLYMPSYLSQHFQFAPANIYLAITWSMIWSVLVLPIFGWLADRLGKTSIFVASCLVFVIGAFPLFSLLSAPTAWLVLFMLLYQTVIAGLSVGYFPILAAAFPTQVRYTGIAACYNIAYALLGTSPLVLTALIEWTHTAYSAVWFLITLAIISAISCFKLSRYPAVLKTQFEIVN